MVKSIYKISKFFMLVSGLWKIPISSNPQIQKIYRIYAKIVQLNYILFNLSLIIRVMEMLIGETQIDTMYGEISLAILIMEINFKVMIYLKNKVPEMFWIIVEREEQILTHKDKDIVEAYTKQVKYYKFAIFCQYVSVGSTIGWFIVVNLYMKFVTNSLPNNNFMYQLWFPFDKEKHDMFVVFYNVFMACWGFFFNCSIHTPLQSLMVFPTSQLRILQLNIKNCIASNGNVEDLKDLIREHQLVIEFVNNLNKSTKYVILLDYTLESVNGAGALVEVIKVKEVIKIPFSLLYLVLLIMNLITLSWSANEIIIQSKNVANAVYESNWMDQNKEIKELLFFMLMRSQKPLSIDVGPFRQMNNEAALLTMKASYTYAQVLTHRRPEK